VRDTSLVALTYLVGEAALQDAVPGDLTHITGAQLPQLGGDGVLLHQRFLRCEDQCLICAGSYRNKIRDLRGWDQHLFDRIRHLLMSVVTNVACDK